jgi:hypothetical protein
VTYLVRHRLQLVTPDAAGGFETGLAALLNHRVPTTGKPGSGVDPRPPYPA